ncbi:Kelch repeat-containing protein [Polyangium aurulentum]|uniref:Kelch repeat-containing protein n=1 Tax=Polyangium aurulentum TaxID=2567896 RepID=UPI00146C6D54|nr:hypothetical protein [Polyangium aurulentum]UQA61066.1 hypothetical protein E8A73_011545 [Polyangium aurulentum]
MGGTAALVLLAGCPDSLTLDPVSSSGPAGGTGGSGGSAPIPCSSNTDCPAPTAVCDTVRNVCVECLEVAHCSETKPGTVCSQGACACPTITDEYCAGSMRCANKMTSVTDCGACGHECYGACNEGKCADGWERTPTKNAPAARGNHVAVGTDTQMIVWGGLLQGNVPTSTGGVLDLVTGTWTKTSESNVPVARSHARAVWTGTQMVVWGGLNGPTPVGTGGVYNPTTNTWTPMSNVGAPVPRYGHSMVWAGPPISKVLVWGGHDAVANFYGDGATYDIASDTWAPISTVSPPLGRMDHAAVWTGQAMLVWGGYGPNGQDNFLGDGALYNPSEPGTWTPITLNGAPTARTRPAGAWTGTELIVWGGAASANLFADGARYVPMTDAWTLTATDGAPEARQYHTAVWVGGRYVVWGGQNGAPTPVPFNSGAIFDPTNNKWKAMPTAPQARAHHTAVDVGGKMVIWGGSNGSAFVDTGGVFDPSAVQ